MLCVLSSSGDPDFTERDKNEMFQERDIVTYMHSGWDVCLLTLSKSMSISVFSRLARFKIT